jgi:hypothetical protein
LDPKNIVRNSSLRDIPPPRKWLERKTQCDRQDEMYSWPPTLRSRAECHIDGVADAAYLVGEPKLGEPISKLLRE